MFPPTTQEGKAFWSQCIAHPWLLLQEGRSQVLLLERIATLSPSNIIRHHFHCYADDTELYISSKSISHITPTTHSTITNCLTDLKTWMGVSVLELNSDTSENSHHQIQMTNKSHHNFSNLSIDGTTVPASSCL